MLIRARMAPHSCRWGSRLACSNSASMRRTPKNLTRKDHAEIPEDDGKRWPRAACEHFQINFRERKLGSR